MTRRLLFQVHWFLGITAGIVLAVMGVTGATMSFEREIMDALSPHIVAPGVPRTSDLSPEALITRVESDHPGFRVYRLEWEMVRDRSHAVRIEAENGNRREGRVDRATGRWLGEPNGAFFFETVRNIHRWLALPGRGNGIGRQITGFSALALIFFALSGLYLRWPRDAGNWREWVALDFRKSGRNLWRALHAVVGTWLLVFYLLSATTGLWWSYDWYRRAATYTLTGTAVGKDAGDAAPKVASVKAPSRQSIDASWASFIATAGSRYSWVAINLPKAGKSIISLQALPVGARHERQWDRFSYNAATGRQTKQALYAGKPIGIVLSESMVTVHGGGFFGMTGRILLFLSSMTMPLFTITGFLLYLSRRKRQRAARNLAVMDGEQSTDAGAIVIAFASQTGTAELKARRASLALTLGGVANRVVPIHALTTEMLTGLERLLLVVSTYGDGEPPDMARGFKKRVMSQEIDLSALRFGLLALGDTDYTAFCAFGRAVEDWLVRCGASPLHPTILMDREDAGAEREWQAVMASLGAIANLNAPSHPAFTPWRLISRERLNPSSQHGPVYHLKFQPPADMPAWQAGDLAEIMPEPIVPELAVNDAETHRYASGSHGSAAVTELPPAMLMSAMHPRSYSIASVHDDGTLDLVVRQVRGADGILGLGSAWLTRGVDVGSTVDLRIRGNPAFHVPADGRRLILIGNGTGIAGLRAHLRNQAIASRKAHWLLFGERECAHDAYFDDELQGWLDDGTLSRLNRAYSRDAQCGRYVQHLVSDHAADVVAWIEAGATIIVCGSLQGMADGVHQALSVALGEEILTRLIEQKRYLRDVY